MTAKDYALDISGSGNVRMFQLKKLRSNYPLPQLTVAMIRVSDDSQNTPEGLLFRYFMKSKGIQEVQFNWSTHSVHVTGTTAATFDDIDIIEHLVRVLINSHFNAARQA